MKRKVSPALERCLPRLWLGFLALALANDLRAEESNRVFAIDLATTLRLAGARNLDVQIAREQLHEAEARHEQATARFLPWIAPALGYWHHEGHIQETEGNILDASRQSYNAGVTLNAQLDLGDAIYQSLAAHQQVAASREALAATRQDTLWTAASAYFELARAKASMGATREAVRISEDYAGQVHQAVDAGIAFRGDAQRAEVQVQKNRILLRQAEEQQQTASARLVQTLHLEPELQLDPRESESVPLFLVATNTALGSLMGRALATRPELRQHEALAASARELHRGAKYGPLVPTLGAQVGVSGVGGGPGGDWNHFGDAEDYVVGLRWRIGPGGLLDPGRVRAAEAKDRSAALELAKARDTVAREVTEAWARAQSLTDQLALSRQALAAAEATLELSQGRKAFGVGAVLETIQAEQELTRARLDYLALVAASNQAQYSLKRALGELEAEPAGQVQ